MHYDDNGNEYRLISKFVHIIHMMISFNQKIDLKNYLSDIMLLNKCKC